MDVMKYYETFLNALDPIIESVRLRRKIEFWISLCSLKLLYV